VFRQIVKAQWMHARLIVLLFLFLAFTVPLLSVMYGGDVGTGSSFQVATWLNASRVVGQGIPYVALGLGVLLGMSTWAPDHAGRHVYALSLPLPRWQFVLMRFVAGCVLILIPAAALLAGSLVAIASVSLPDGVHAYPMALTARFLLSALLMYSVFFAISIGTRRAVVLTLGTIGGLVLADIMLGAFGREAVVVTTIVRAMTRYPGPLAILLGRWALFDV